MVKHIEFADIHSHYLFDRNGRNSYVGEDGIWRFDDAGREGRSHCEGYDGCKPWYFEVQTLEGPVSEDGVFCREGGPGRGREVVFAELDGVEF